MGRKEDEKIAPHCDFIHVHEQVVKQVMKQMRLVKFRRDGRSVLYSLADSHIETILAQGMEHIGE